MIQLSPVFTRTLRFKANASYTNNYFTRACFYNLLVMANGASGYALVAGARLRRVRVWSCPPPGATGTTAQFNSLQLTWSGAPGPGSAVEVSGNALSPAYLDCRPPKGSLASLWGDVGATTSPLPGDILCYISGGGGDIIDITYEYTIAMDGLGYAAKLLTTSVSGTTGTVVRNCLDNTLIGGGAGSETWIGEKIIGTGLYNGN